MQIHTFNPLTTGKIMEVSFIVEYFIELWFLSTTNHVQPLAARDI